MSEACASCLQRTWLVARLAPYIETVVCDRPGARVRELLALPDGQLCEALAGSDGQAIEEEIAAKGAETRLEAIEVAGLWAICRHSRSYPSQLYDLGGEAPATLIGRGDRKLLASLGVDTSVTVVGSRRAGAYGRQVASGLAFELASAGIAVVSGMANGIDASAHHGALDGGGVTIAVLGGGAETASPAGQSRLYERIVAAGAAISELPPGTRPHRWTFPARNRVMAALARLTIVVEAAERSGSLITATMASDLNRDVGAVPGPVTSWLSSGANALLADGAHLIRGAQDVLDLMLGPGAAVVERHGPELDDALEVTLGLVEQGHGTCDAIAAASGGSASDTAVSLARLELLGYLRSDAIGRYAATTLRPPLRKL